MWLFLKMLMNALAHRVRMVVCVRMTKRAIIVLVQLVTWELTAKVSGLLNNILLSLLGAELDQLVRWMTLIRRFPVRISKRPSEKNLLVLLDKALYLRLSWIMTIFCPSIMSMAMSP